MILDVETACKYIYYIYVGYSYLKLNKKTKINATILKNLYSFKLNLYVFINYVIQILYFYYEIKLLYKTLNQMAN